MKFFQILISIYKSIVARIRGFWHLIQSARFNIALVSVTIVIIFQFIAVSAVHADYKMTQTSNFFARMINAPINLTASVFDSVRSFMNTVSGGKIGGSAQAIDGRAIREKNRGTPITTQEVTKTPSVNINAVAGFKKNVEFGTGFTSQAGVTINGLLNGKEINLGGGKITAGNILYSLSSGEGIDVGGNPQRPIISLNSSSNLWKKENTTIVTRDPLLSLAIDSNLTVGANLTIGATTTGSLFHLLGTSTTAHDAFATIIVAHNLASAWSITESATSTPVVSIDSRNNGSVSIGSATSTAKLAIKNSQLGSIAFQINAADGQQANVFEINNAVSKSLLIVDAIGRLGIGTNSLNAALTVASTSYFSGSVTASSSVYLAVGSGRVGIGTVDPQQTLSVKGTFNVTGDARFETAPIFATVANCSGNGVLETDGDGRVTCGQDDVGSGGSPPAKDKGEVNSGSAGAIAFYNGGGNTVSQAVGLFYENSTGRFGIGTTSPTQVLSVHGDALIGNITATGTITVLNSTATSTFANGINVSAGCFSIGGACVAGGSAGTVNSGTVNRLAYYQSANVVNSVNFLTVDATNGLLGIATTTPSSTFSVSGSTYLNSNVINIASSSATTLTVNYLTSATTTVPAAVNAYSIATSPTATPVFSLDTINNFAGIGTPSPRANLEISYTGSGQTLLQLTKTNAVNQNTMGRLNFATSSNVMVTLIGSLDGLGGGRFNIQTSMADGLIDRFTIFRNVATFSLASGAGVPDRLWSMPPLLHSTRIRLLSVPHRHPLLLSHTRQALRTQL